MSLKESRYWIKTAMHVYEHILKRVILTGGKQHHFFGYYDKNQFDQTNKYVLGQAVKIENQSPGPEDTAEIGLINLSDGNSWKTIARTTAWCWQQGCMLQWTYSNPEQEIFYNIRSESNNKYEACFHNIVTNGKKIFPHPLYTLSPDGTFGISNDFARVANTRPGYGYNGIPDLNKNINAPDDTGIQYVNLKTGQARMIVAIVQLARIKTSESMKVAKHWINHILVSPDSKRLIFLHRWQQKEESFRTRMYTVSPDGSDLHMIMDEDMEASHFAWRDPEYIIVYGCHPQEGYGYLLINEKTKHMQIVGKGVLQTNGHMTYSPQGTGWILSDTYPDEQELQELFLFHEDKGEKIIIDQLRHPKVPQREFRCDLHPRWSSDGKKVVIDSLDNGTRQMYMYDVADIVR